MELKDKRVSKKSAISIILYIAASIVALLGVALLVNNILLFKSTISQYVAQGYPVDVVSKQLIPTQLLPGIFQSVGVYGGIAFALLGAGIINKNISKCLVLLNKDETCCNVEESVLEQNIADVENTETPELEENVEENKNE